MVLSCFWKSLWRLGANSPLNAQDEDLKCGRNPSKHKIMKSVSFQELRRMEQCYLWGHQDTGHLRGKASMEEKRKVPQKYCQRHSLLLPRALASCRKALDCRMTSFLKRTSPTGQLFPVHRPVWACSETLALLASPVLSSSTGVCNTDSLNISNSCFPALVLTCPQVFSVISGGVLQF